MNNLVRVKTNKKSEVYENDDYIVTISDIDGYVMKKMELIIQNTIVN